MCVYRVLKWLQKSLPDHSIFKISQCEIGEIVSVCNQGRIEPPKAGRGHATYVNVKIQTRPPVPKISYAVYGYTMFAHAQFTHASGCKSHSYAIKQIHGWSQPPFPYTAVANIRKTPPCLNLDIHAFTWQYMGVTCSLAAFGGLIHPWCNIVAA